MKPINWEELHLRITNWVNERPENWTDEEASRIRSLRKLSVFWIRYTRGLSLDEAYYAFENVKQTYLEKHS